MNSGSVGGPESGSGAAATGGGGEEEEEVPVDESLFTEQGDDPVNQDDDGEAAGVEDEVPVDESLFDIENLDIDDDPSVSQTQGET